MQELQTRVLRLVSKIPRGRVTTYKEIARALGKPLAYRAVANALAKNPDRRLPCHRVIRSSGEVGGYKFGAKRKVKMLTGEGIEIKDGRVDLEKYSFRLSR